ncbi:MAG: DnaD domain protein [Clostridia bacterium]|nr:DnaD domain protein [Clostridia bacterium]
MNYNISLGNWGSIFAVPTSVVDKYLKIAGSAQLKVLLYVLRHNNENITDNMIAGALNIDVFDVRDSIEFWASFDIIGLNNGVIAQPKSEYKELPNNTPKSAPIVEEKPVEPPAVTPKEEKTETPPQTPQKPSDVTVARPLRPDPIYVAQRINEDPVLKDLLNEAQYILGRPLSPNENAGIIMLLDNEGLPGNVIIMLLSYGVSNQKGMRQIEAMGAQWAKDGIVTLEQADERIRELEESKEAYHKIQSVLGLKFRKASKAEETMYNCWLNEWNFSEEVIKEAYDICVDNKGEYIPKYVNTILKNWHDAGITTVDQARSSRRKSAGQTGSASYGNQSYDNSSFDIDELSSLSSFND